jgi:hypothetical protein
METRTMALLASQSQCTESTLVNEREYRKANKSANSLRSEHAEKQKRLEAWSAELSNGSYEIDLPQAQKQDDLDKFLSFIGKELSSIRAALERLTSTIDKNKIILATNSTDLGLPAFLSSEVLQSNSGFFADLLAPAPENTNNPFMHALGLLLEPFLGIRICRDKNAASASVSMLTKARVSARIWPLDSLQLNKGSTEDTKTQAQRTINKFNSIVTELYQKQNIEAVYPVSQLQWDELTLPGLSVVAVKAVGRWLIVENDETASRVMALKIKDIYGCITFSGNRHIVGQLIVSDITQNKKQHRGKHIMSKLLNRHVALNDYKKDLKLFEELTFLLDHMEPELSALQMVANREKELDVQLQELSQKREILNEERLGIESEKQQLQSLIEHGRRMKLRLQEDISYWEKNCNQTETLDSLPVYNAKKRENITNYLNSLETKSANLNRRLEQLSEVDLANSVSRTENFERQLKSSEDLLIETHGREQELSQTAQSVQGEITSLIKDLTAAKIDTAGQMDKNCKLQAAVKEEKALCCNPGFTAASQYWKSHLESKYEFTSGLVIFMLPSILGLIIDNSSPNLARHFYETYSCPDEDFDSNLVAETTFIAEKCLVNTSEADLCLICSLDLDGTKRSAKACCVFASHHLERKEIVTGLRQLKLTENDLLKKFYSLKARQIEASGNVVEPMYSEFDATKALAMIRQHPSDGSTHNTLHLLSLQEKFDQVCQ